MNRVRVLIVESSSILRELLRQSLGNDSELEIVAVTASSQVALTKAADLHPDVLILDISPPELEGLKTLAALRQKFPTLSIVVFSKLATCGSQLSVDALLAGANECVVKPETDADLERCIRGELTQKLKSLAVSPKTAVSPAITGGTKLESQRLTPLPSVPVRQSPATFTARPTRAAMQSVDIVAIAASTGGPNALGTVLSGLTGAFRTPVVIVQHMGVGFTSSLADYLSRQSGRVVREVESARPLHEAPVWVATGGRHVVVSQQSALVDVGPDDSPPENNCRPSADVLFRSVSAIYGSRALAVVLTGMGCDGLAGCRAIRQAGGTVIAQDEASSVSWGMPGQVAGAGLADVILPLNDIAQEIQRRTVRR